MNIHEHQAKQILKKYGAAVPEGVSSHSVEELLEKAKSLKTEKFVLKAQIHAGGRGKAGGVKIVNTIEELNAAANEMLGKKLITHQTGPQGREVKRLYVESSSNIIRFTLVVTFILIKPDISSFFYAMSFHQIFVSVLVLILLIRNDVNKEERMTLRE